MAKRNIGMIELEWTPEPYVVEQEVHALAGQVSETGIPLTWSREVVIADVEERFRTETAPNGMSWAPLSERYQQWKDQRSSGGILVLDGNMKQEATSVETYPISGDTLFFNSSNMPEYWSYNQFGAPDRKTRTGKDNPLPQREFIGLSSQAESQIFALFNDWMNGLLGGVTTHHLRPSTVQRRMAGTQRFGPKF